MKIKLDKSMIIKYLVSISVLFISLYIVTLFYDREGNKSTVTTIIETDSITDSNEKYNINVNYPRFKDDNCTKIITDYIYSYVKDFKSNENLSKKLSIDYELYYYDKYVNIVFSIDNSISNDKYHNIIIDLDNKKEATIIDLYGNEIKDRIYNNAYYKYTSDIYNLIINNNLNTYTYIISDNFIYIYFDSIDFSNYDYDPYLKISIYSDEYVFEEINNDDTMKHIAFTFDDGPGDYTLDILKTLEYNSSSATFFMLGNKMKYNEETVLKIYNSNSEVGTHTYSHKYLTSLSEEDIKSEINSSTILFNQITNGNIYYLRPPYGNYNDLVLKASPYPLILWNIDPKDWLTRNSNDITQNILDNACDGCIVLMHDIYKETAESLKTTIPELKNMGYEVVSISNLLKIKNKELKAGEAINKVE